MSVGSRSGVNCTRLNSASNERARALANVVLPTPGTSSMRMCPPPSSAVSRSRMTSGLPRITLPSCACRPERTSRGCGMTAVRAMGGAGSADPKPRRRRLQSRAMAFSRRDLLRGLAGLGMAGTAAGCARGGRGRAITGGIVGGAHARGHRVRDGFRPVPESWRDVTVAVLGAGVAGLSAAWALDRAGLSDFAVLELEDAPGGTARSGQDAVTPYPWGAHYVPVPSPDNRALVALLDEVGAVADRDAQGRPVYAEDVLCRDPQERVFFRGEWYEGLYPRAGASPRDLEELRAFEAEMRRWSLWRDARGRRAFDLPRARGSDADEVRALDGLSMAAWLDARGWSSPRLRWLVEYGCRDDFGATLAQTSAWAGVHYFAARLDAS